MDDGWLFFKSGSMLFFIRYHLGGGEREGRGGGGVTGRPRAICGQGNEKGEEEEEEEEAGRGGEG